MKKCKFVIILICFSIMAGAFIYKKRSQQIKEALSHVMFDTEMYYIEKCPLTKQDGNNNLFSQFYEDYILSYIFSDQIDGFYIDVGVNDPYTANTTKYFYDQGWKGLNFEPQLKYYNLLLASRPKDININKAVTDNIGETTFYLPEGKEGWATIEPKISEILTQTATKYQIVTVPTTTLDFEIEKHNINNVDLLKIDVESYEHVVLSGINLQKIRPKIIVAEARSPIDFNGNLKFEPILITNNYDFGMTDGLNYYYYRKENPEFSEKFKKIHRCVTLAQLKRNVYCQNKDNCSF